MALVVPYLIPASVWCRGVRNNLEMYKRLTVENYIQDIIYELYKIPEARRRFCLGNVVWFESYTNSLEGDATLNDGTLDDKDRLLI